MLVNEDERYYATNFLISSHIDFISSPRFIHLFRTCYKVSSLRWVDLNKNVWKLTDDGLPDDEPVDPYDYYG